MSKFDSTLLRPLFLWQRLVRLIRSPVLLKRRLASYQYSLALSKENFTSNAAAFMAREYANLACADGPQLDLSQFEYKVFSQFGEDGIIAEILSRIGLATHRIVEIGVGDGTECNSLNLLVNFGWTGLLIEGSSSFASSANEALATNFRVSPDKFTVLNKFIDVENINGVISDAGFNGQVDVLSIDVDGNDIWLLKEVTTISPRLIIVEYNSALGPDLAISIPYRRDFVWARKDPEKRFYYGASVTALTKVAKQKGYSLVHGTRTGVNLFFVRSDLMTPDLVEITPQQAHRPNIAESALRRSIDISLLVAKYPFVEH